MAKASDNVFPKVITGMQTADPSAPSDSSWKVYAKAGGIYARSSNAVVGPFAAASGGGSFSFLGARAKKTTQNINTATITAVTFDAEDYDTSAFHDNSTNPTRMTIPATGKYRIGAGGHFGFSASNEIDLWIGLNGTSTISSGLVGTSAPTGATAKLITISGDVLLSSGDYIEVFFYHDNGSTRALTSAYFTVQRLDP